MSAQVLGGTKWKRFALVMVPTVGIAGAMTVAMANGVLASSFAVSGQQFKVSADRLDGQTFAQSGTVIVSADGKAHAVAVAGIKTADIKNMCQSVNVPIPVLGNLTIVLKAGAGTPVHATDLVLDTNQVDADAEFKGVNIGASAKSIQDHYHIDGFQKSDEHGQLGTDFAPGDFGQVVDQATLTGVRQTAYSTTAGTMSLKGLSISANLNGTECF
ncbi:MAG: cholesterol esterase [Catenulispora sp.]|nr:cholesterol esterase [Catenulispora sp.]